MPKGPKGEMCPANVIGCAVHVARIVTGESKTGLRIGCPPVLSEERSAARLVQMGSPANAEERLHGWAYGPMG